MPQQPATSIPSTSKRLVAIVYRQHTDHAHKKAVELAEKLQAQGHTVLRTAGQKLARLEELSPDLIPKLDLVVVLGGDGTYLAAVRQIGDAPVPLLGINMGSLGFLTDTKIEDLDAAVQTALDGNLALCERAMLSIDVVRRGLRRARHLALNDVVLERGSITHLINIEISSERNVVGQIKADALIVATPTGSTAYNLAAGGPILHPDADAFVVTPVCPHALTSRPLIFPDHQRLRLKVPLQGKEAILTVDGALCGEITDQDEIVIVRHSKNHLTLRKPSYNFFTLLREKLKFGERN